MKTRRTVIGQGAALAAGLAATSSLPRFARAQAKPVKIAIIVPLSFSRAISFEFPPPGYWTGYYSQYFGSPAWLDATANSFIIAFGSMVFTLLVALPARHLGGVVAGAGERAGLPSAPVSPT